MSSLPARILASLLTLAGLCALPLLGQNAAPDGPPILTPATPPVPRIHGPKVFGVRPDSPFLYTIPATGRRPMQFAADGLPAGLTLDSATGQIKGSLRHSGNWRVVFRARNSLGQVVRPFTIIADTEIGLTPAMGWNSFNTYDVKVTQKQVLAAAHAMIESGLAQHGWSYINTDDGWQGVRGGKFNAIQPNEGFPDIAGMVEEIHGLGLKAGIYSTPWVTSYGRRIGGPPKIRGEHGTPPLPGRIATSGARSSPLRSALIVSPSRMQSRWPHGDLTT